MIIYKDFKTQLQDLKDIVTLHNENKRWWQPEWKLNENFIFFTIYYNGFPNPFKLHKTIYGLSWSAFPKEHQPLLIPEDMRTCKHF